MEVITDLDAAVQLDGKFIGGVKNGRSMTPETAFNAACNLVAVRTKLREEGLDLLPYTSNMIAKDPLGDIRIVCLRAEGKRTGGGIRPRAEVD